jgi:hypothetical protein
LERRSSQRPISKRCLQRAAFEEVYSADLVRSDEKVIFSTEYSESGL